jgi:phenylacetate-CoA ligase
MSQKQCDCGRHSKLLESISGRTADVIYIKDDVPVTAAFFVSMFIELHSDWFEHFTRFQVYQKKKGELVFRLEKADKNKVYPESGKRELLKHLQTLSNNVELEILDNLQPDKSGKFRYVISDVKE